MTEPESIAAARQKDNKEKTVFQVLFEFFSSFGLACVLLILLTILTWLGTLEQVDHGLNATVKKYFSSDSFIIFPHIGEKVWPLPLPGAFWVSALLFINMVCGGIIRARKGWKTAGVLVSHSGILMMLVGGAITHWTAERGNMVLFDGQTSNVAESYDEYVIEVGPVKDGKLEKIQLIDTEYLAHLNPDDRRIFKLSEMPFDFELTGWQTNSQPQNVAEGAPRNQEPIIDGYFLRGDRPDNESPRNYAGAYITPLEKDGTKGAPFILAAASFHPVTFTAGGETYAVRLRKKLWQMPFDTRLTEFRVEFYPGISRAKSYESDIVRIGDDGTEVPVHIKMNEPMRYKGFTFFQASWGPENAKPGEKLYTVFEVVKDPADKWPEISLWVVTVGLLIHFGIMLIRYVSRAVSPKPIKNA